MKEEKKLCNNRFRSSGPTVTKKNDPCFIIVTCCYHL
ncbi:unnamed protein product [Brassica oleracea var. botrytis]